MEKLTTSKLQEIRKDIDAALLAVAEKHGLEKLEALKCKYDPERGNFAFNLEGVVIGGLDEKAFLYSLWASTYGWPEIFSVFSYKGQSYKIIGCNKTKTKIHCQTGALIYDFDAGFVKITFDLEKSRLATGKKP